MTEQSSLLGGTGSYVPTSSFPGSNNQSQYSSEPPPNWPAFKPFIYHDIDQEIKPEWHLVLKRQYLLVGGVAIASTWNLLTMIISLASGPAGVLDLLLALAYFPLAPVAALKIYLVLYNATKLNTDFSSRKFGLFMGLSGLEVLIEALFAIGIPGLGAGGLILLIDAVGSGQLLAALCHAVACGCWGCLAAIHLGYLLHVRQVRSELSAGGNRQVYTDDATYTFEPSHTYPQQQPSYQYDDDEFMSSAHRTAQGMAYQAAVDNKDALAQAAYDNREVIADTLYDHRHEIADAVAENSSAIAGAVYNNRAAIGDAMFGSSSHSSS